MNRASETWQPTMLDEGWDETYGLMVEIDGSKILLTGPDCACRGRYCKDDCADVTVTLYACARCHERCTGDYAIDPDGAEIPVCEGCADWLGEAKTSEAA